MPVNSKTCRTVSVPQMLLLQSLGGLGGLIVGLALVVLLF
jgi:hypothetical protein